MAKKQKTQRIKKLLPAFTLVELMIVVIVMGLLAGLVSLATVSIQKSSRDTARDANVKIISTALEKYYRKNGEYPSVALMTSQDVTTLKQKLKIVSTNVFKLPMADDTTKNSIVTSNPSPTRLLYVANTSNSTKNTQCQTDINGYCDGFTLQYKKESDGTTAVATSLHNTFTPVSGTATCAAGETQSGNTCTKTYAATYQSGSYTCPSGGTLSGSTCTSTYTANYSSGGYYSCPSGGTLSGSTCSTTSTYAATYTNPTFYCPNGGSLGVDGTVCVTGTNSATLYSCPHSDSDSMNAQGNCRHERPNYNTQSGCQSAGYTWGGSNCFSMHGPDANTTYSCSSGWSKFDSSTCLQSAAQLTPGSWGCPSGGTFNGSNCTVTNTYAATYNSTAGSYYCNGSDTLNGSTCTHTYTGTQGASYYTCPSGGTLSSTTCTYSYNLP